MLLVENTTVVSTMVIIVKDKVIWQYSYYDLFLCVESYIEQHSIPSKRYV